MLKKNRVVMGEEREMMVDLYRTDVEQLLSDIKKEEKQLQFKRRWLIGVPVFEDKKTRSNYKKLKSERDKLSRYCNKYLPESLIRDDDIFYETVKKCVQDKYVARAADTADEVIQRTGPLVDETNMKRILFSRLDALTNNGLYLVAVLLTGGSVNFEKTRPVMKRVIKELVPRVLKGQNHLPGQTEIFRELSRLLSDPTNVRDNCQSDLVVALKVLDKLEDLPNDVLHAMLSTLVGDPTEVPLLKEKKDRFHRDALVHQLRTTSEEWLSELGDQDELQPPLAKALSIAGLLLSFTQGCPNSYMTDFNQFSPETKALQNDIAKAMWLLKTKVRSGELEALQQLLDPSANVSRRCLRNNIRKIMIGYLFECSDLHSVPGPLLKALNVINSGSRSVPSGGFLKEVIEEEVECILNVSAQTKQIILDLLPSNKFVTDFTGAYFEDVEDSENDKNDYCDAFDLDMDVVMGDEPADLSLREESVCDNIEVDSEKHMCMPEQSCGPPLLQEKGNLNGMLQVDPVQLDGVNGKGKFGTSSIRNGSLSPHFPPRRWSEDSPMEGSEPKDDPMMDPGGLRGTCKNLYLAIQEICDETSMLAYNLTGHLMKGLANKEHNLHRRNKSDLRSDYYSSVDYQEKSQNSSESDLAGSIIFRAVEELMPSLPKSGIEKLKELMSM